MRRTRDLLVVGATVLQLGATAIAAADTAAAIVDQLLVHGAEIHLSAEQTDALRALQARQAATVRVLTERLEQADRAPTAAARQDAVALRQELGRLPVLTARDALLLLTPDQRREWVALRQPPAR